MANRHFIDVDDVVSSVEQEDLKVGKIGKTTGQISYMSMDEVRAFVGAAVNSALEKIVGKVDIGEIELASRGDGFAIFSDGVAIKAIAPEDLSSSIWENILAGLIDRGSPSLEEIREVEASVNQALNSLEAVASELRADAHAWLTKWKAVKSHS